MPLRNSLSGGKYSSDLAVIGYIAGIKFVLQVAAINGYGYFRDEFYYIACSQNLSFGYVDHPPLAMLLLKGIRSVLGDSVFALRIFPALCGFFFVLMTGLIARELGGKKFAVVLASAVALAPVGNFFTHVIYSMNALDHMFWLGCVYVLIKIVKTGNNKLWILFGFLAGLGLQNKISILFLGFGLAVGLLLTPARKYLKSKYLWMGLLLALLIFSPFIIWNMNNGWAHLEFMDNAKTFKNYAVSPGEFMLGQVLFNNPITMPIWVVGILFLLFNREGKKYRFFGWMFLSLFILFMLQHAKDYYLAGAYPIVFAAGSVQFERWLNRLRWGWTKTVLFASIMICAIMFAPMALPILQVDTYIDYAKKIGVSRVQGENHEFGILPQRYADMFGWEEMVGEVARVYNTLSLEEQNKCAIFAGNYGEAGAISLLGKKHGLPEAISGHNSYFLWGPGSYKGDIVIFVGGDYDDLVLYFDEVYEAGRTDCAYCMPYENNMPIFICRGLKSNIIDFWPKVKSFG